MPARTFAAAAVLVAGLIAAPAEAEGPPELAAVTTVTGSGPSSIVVNLASPATISGRVDGNKDISVDGDGRYIGVALVDEADEERLGTVLLAGRIDAEAICDETGCPYGVATPVIGAGLEWDEQTGDYTIPAGIYRLHLIAESSP
ncbi:MAG: hypothetical protein ACRDXF_04145, partial [Acidimicrobiia bacterium]